MVEIESKPDFLWTPVSVRPRCEKVVAQYCRGIGLAHYLPLRRRLKRYQRRNVETLLPMFPGYLFVQLGREETDLLVRCNKIARILRIDQSQERQLLPELRSLQILEASELGSELVVAPELVPGTPVEIVEGPFAGMAGIVTQRGKSTRVSVNVEMLGQSVSVDLDVGEVVAAE
jgi:transcriptional antiterminator RfaH